MTEGKRGDYVCNLCAAQGKDFRVPAGDPIGVGIMRQHLADEHPQVWRTTGGQTR